MSAYVVDREVIDGLVAAALDRRHGSGLCFDHDGERYVVESSGSTLDGVRSYRRLVMGADELGASLWWENVLSCAYRYPNDVSGTRPGPCDFTDGEALGYAYRRADNPPAPIVLGLIEELDYQSCEHPGWVGSLACAALDALRLAQCGRLADRDGASAWCAARARRRERWGVTAG